MTDLKGQGEKWGETTSDPPFSPLTLIQDPTPLP